MSFPWTDWQFWVVTAICLAAAYFVVRPLLPWCRDDLEGWLRRRDLAWREDASNLDPRHLRNRVRHEVLPALEPPPEATLRAGFDLVAVTGKAADLDITVGDWVLLAPDELVVRQRLARQGLFQRRAGLLTVKVKVNDFFGFDLGLVDTGLQQQGQVGGIDDEGAGGAVPYPGAEPHEDLEEGQGIADARHVVEPDRLIGQKRRGNDRQRGVLVTRRAVPARYLLPSPDEETTHSSP